MNQGKRINLVVYALIIILIVLIVLLVFYKNSSNGLDKNQYVYKNPQGEEFIFTKSNVDNLTLNVLTAYVDKNGLHQYQIPFRNNPNDLKNISIEPNIKNKILNKQGIFITLNPNLKSDAVIAAVEISRVIGTNDYGVFKIPTQSATTIPTNTTYPVINCNDATKDTGVILIGIGNYTRIFSNKECVIVEGDNYDNLIKAADKLSLHLLNVM